MISVSELVHSFKGKKIFNGLNWNIKKNKKYGLVGPNGTGKTSLLEVISGRLKTECGKVKLPNKIVIGYLPQDLKYELGEKTVVEEALEALSCDGGAIDYGSAGIKYKAEKILTGLGFGEKQLDEKTSILSGGWKMRIELAKILLKEPNVLLLDEPTNHLDIQSIEWIENFLKNFNGTVVIVSHDKYLLDRMVDTIAELERGQITEYAGNYSNYITEKENRDRIQLSSFENQQRKIQQTERFIERFRYKNTKAKQVQSRIKMLEKMELVKAPVSETKKIKLKFPEAPRSGKIVYELSEFSKSYKTGDENINQVFENSGPLKIERGDKIAVAGKNGEGKSTLAKMIVGIEKFNGSSKLGYNVKLSYYAQNQSENLNLENTVYNEFLTVASHFSDTQARSILGSFLFNEDELEKKVKVLSGGEKSRLSLSKMLVSPSNFLVLDEPTNHLDIQSRQILLEALKSYSGSFIIISHDRYFIDQLVNKVWYVEDKNVETHLGNYTDFIKRTHGVTRELSEKTVEQEERIASLDDKKARAEKRNKLFRELKEKGIENMPNWKELSDNQLGKALAELEARISNFENDKIEIEKLMNDPEFFKNQNEAKEKTKDLGEISAKLKVMYQRWDELAEYFGLE